MKFYIMKKSNFIEDIQVIAYENDYETVNNFNLNGYLIIDVIEAKNHLHAIRIFHSKKEYYSYDYFALICKVLSAILIFISVIILISSAINFFFTQPRSYGLDDFLNSYSFYLVFTFCCVSFFFYFLSLSVNQLKDDMIYIKTM
ncbi:hypothetical protein BST98_18855 [Photobacterium damselae]|nr:hypothetical protein BST98_18855 [Photobacterium damselae]